MSLSLAAACKVLAKSFLDLDNDGPLPMILLEDGDGHLTAYRIDPTNGYMHRVHRELEWLEWDEATKHDGAVDFIEDGSAPTPPPAFK